MTDSVASIDRADRAETAPIPALIPIALTQRVTVYYSTRLGGGSEDDWAFCNLGATVGEEPNQVHANRRAVNKIIGSPVHVVTQVHSALVVDTDAIVQTKSAEALGQIQADGQVTSQADRAVGIFTADCLPVFLADPGQGIVGAAHCGRKGLQAGVLQTLVEAMIALGAHRSDLTATLGPRICGRCYQVGDDIAEDFDRQFPGTVTHSRFGGQGIDISLAALQILAHEGIHGRQIVDSSPRVKSATYYLESDPEFQQLCQVDGQGPDLTARLDEMADPMCTLENPLWYSHRRAVRAGKKHEGRQLSIIVRKE